jgi:hypothetical protein
MVSVFGHELLDRSVAVQEEQVRPDPRLCHGPTEEPCHRPSTSKPRSASALRRLAPCRYGGHAEHRSEGSRIDSRIESRGEVGIDHRQYSCDRLSLGLVRHGGTV